MRLTSEKIKKYYTIFVVLLPLVSVYASGIPGFTLGDILLLLFLICRLILGIKNKKLQMNKNTMPLILLSVAIVLISLISVLEQGSIDIYSIVIRIVRRIFYYLCVAIISSEWFIYDFGVNCIINAGKIGTIYLMIQYIFFYLGNIVLNGFIPFLPVYHENYTQIDYYEIYNNMFRPTSFLLEPAHLARYLCIPLTFVLFDKKDKNSKLWAFFLSIAIVASTSGTGTICVILIWLIYGIKYTISSIKSGKLRLNHIIILIFMIVFFVLSLQTPIVQSTIDRIIGSDLTNVNTAGGARFRGYLQYFQLPIFNLIFGTGYGNMPNTSLVTWFSGASYILYGCGAIGFFICLIVFFIILKKTKTSGQKTLCTIFFVLFFIDDCFMSHVAVVYFSFLCINKIDLKE